MESELKDTTTVYAAVSDVERYVRGQDFDASTDPTDDEILDFIYEASDVWDQHTWVPYRERQLIDWEAKVRLTHEQETPRIRRRAYRDPVRRRGFDDRVRAYMPVTHIRDIDSGEGDSIVVIDSDGTNDITADEGRGDDGSYHWDYRRGVLRMELSLFTQQLPWYGEVDPDPRVQVTVRFGRNPGVSSKSTMGGTDYDVAAVPHDVRRAVAKITAVELVESDYYSMTFNETGVPLETTAQRYERQAKECMDQHRYRPTFT